MPLSDIQPLRAETFSLLLALGEYYEFKIINDYRNQYEYSIRNLKCFEW